MQKLVTCIAPVNIAVIKYWGKRDEELILPLNDSISGTLSTEFMCAKTTIMASRDLQEDKFWLNGKEEPFDTPRMRNCLKEIKMRAADGAGKELAKCHLHICSVNNFPTAAGLASSAAGYACLVSALAALYNVEGNISSVARQGSGSACRSVFGGWVQWQKGCLPDGSDSMAVQIAPASHWPEMRILVLVVNEGRKKVGSTTAMKQSCDNSELLKYRIDKCVPERVERMKEAILKKNFESFAMVTMQDSNQFHAICLDTYPPCVYMNDVSHCIVEAIHAYNNFKDHLAVAYTFDAGPNACLYLLEKEVPFVVSLINHIFPPMEKNVEYMKGIPVEPESLPENFLSSLKIPVQKPGQLKYMLHTKIGEGPQQLKDSSAHLLDASGKPKII